MRLKIISTVMFFLVLPMILYAQEAIPASGGEADGLGGSVSYSIGQMVYTAYTGTNGSSISQGVLHPFEILVISAIPKTDEINLELSAYPNPTSNFINLKIEDITDIQYDAYLFNIIGKIIKKIKITGNETQIDMQNLVPDIYFLKVTANSKEIKVFKIIKR